MTFGNGRIHPLVAGADTEHWSYAPGAFRSYWGDPLADTDDPDDGLGKPAIALSRSMVEQTAPKLSNLIPSWVASANCGDGAVNMFRSHREARNVCAQCPVIHECRQYAIDNAIEFGIWGGMTATERSRFIVPGSGKEADVYVVRFGPYTKIGATNRPLSERISKLRRECKVVRPYPAEVLLFEHGSYGMERDLHAMMRAKVAPAIDTEWYLSEDVERILGDRLSLKAVA